MFLASDIPTNVDLSDYSLLSITIRGVETAAYKHKTKLVEFTQELKAAEAGPWSMNNQYVYQTDENVIAHVLSTDFFRDLEQTQVCTSEEVEVRLQLLRNSGITITEEEV
jgi:hypothetical protein